MRGRIYKPNASSSPSRVRSAILAGLAAVACAFATPVAAQSPETVGFGPGDTVVTAKPGPVRPGTETLHDTVRALIHALNANRADEAFAVAAPSVRASFRDPRLFLAVIARFQTPLYKARKFQFDGIDRAGDRPVVRAYLDAGRNRRWLARFTMEPQADGNWRVLDVSLKRAPGHVI